MDDIILQRVIEEHFRVSRSGTTTFTWHGGEPLLAGMDFYRRAVGIQKRICPPGSSFINGVQTNGTLITEEWCRFLSSENFYVGISIDGPEQFHDLYRKGAMGNATFHRVIKGYSMLRKHGINPEILCVVNSENVRYPLIIYDFFRKLGAEFITFLPLVETNKNAPGTVSERSVPAAGFGSFLSVIFDEWVENDIGKIKIQIIEEAVRTAFSQDHTLCVFKENCGGVPVLEYDGNFYSCDHYKDEQHLIGNILESPVDNLLYDKRQLHFSQIKSMLPGYCRKCEVRSMCNGECPRNRFLITADGEPGLNYLCAGYKIFFNHCMPFIKAVEKLYSL
jgi:uncharacterized protein